MCDKSSCLKLNYLNESEYCYHHYNAVLAKIIKSTVCVLWNQHAYTLSQCCFSDQWVVLWFPPKDFGCSCNWSVCVATVPCADASIRQNIPLHVHRISNELFKCNCKEKFPLVIWRSYYSRAALTQCLIIRTQPSLLPLIPAGSLKHIAECVKWVCANATGRWCSHTYDALRPSWQLLWRFVKICWRLRWQSDSN